MLIKCWDDKTRTILYFIWFLVANVSIQFLIELRSKPFTVSNRFIAVAYRYKLNSIQPIKLSTYNSGQTSSSIQFFSLENDDYLHKTRTKNELADIRTMRVDIYLYTCIAECDGGFRRFPSWFPRWKQSRAMTMKRSTRLFLLIRFFLFLFVFS